MSVEDAPAGSDGGSAGTGGSSAPDGRAGADGPVAWDAAGADSTGAAAFPRSRAVARELVVLPQAGSTNDEAVARVRTGELAAPFSTVATLDQRAGHGRQGRAWRTPAGSALAVSVVVRLESSPRLALLPLIAGAAMCRALRGLGAAAELKWPNDVLIGGAKVCGILCAVAAPGVVVIGSGVNLRFSADDVAHLGLGGTRATALSLEGAVTDPDTVLSAYLAALRDRRRRPPARRGRGPRRGARRVPHHRAACARRAPRWRPRPRDRRRDRRRWRAGSRHRPGTSPIPGRGCDPSATRGGMIET
jgi:BirA family biotin operon repressor/biotin-[acetyl-CoA-carboxylase] ligase